MRDINREHARLIILRTLAGAPGQSSNSAALQDELETYGIRQTRPWVHTEIDYLANLGAVRASEVATVKIVELTQRGNDHLERRITIEGVRRPSLDGG